MRYKPTRNALVKPLDDGAMALNIASGDYYSLNETAARNPTGESWTEARFESVMKQLRGAED